MDANTSKVYEDIATEVNNKSREHGYFDQIPQRDWLGVSLLALMTHLKKDQTHASTWTPSNTTQFIKSFLDVESKTLRDMAKIDPHVLVHSSVQEIVGRSIKDTKTSKPEITSVISTQKFIDMRSADKESGLAILPRNNK